MAKAIAVADEQNTGMQRFKAQPEKLMSFFRDVRSEMRKVIWPGRQDVQSTTIIVLVTVFLFAAYFWLVDNIIGRAIEAVLHKLTTH
jgi:preprotein translocase subunit SecE